MASEAKSKKAAPPKSSTQSNATLKLLETLAANKMKREAAREAERQQRQELGEANDGSPGNNENDPTQYTTTGGGGRGGGGVKQKMPEVEIDLTFDADETLADTMEAFSNTWGLSSTSTADYLNGEQVVFPSNPEEPHIDLSGTAVFTQHTSAFASLFGPSSTSTFSDAALATATATASFKQSLVSGAFIASTMMQKKSEAKIVEALFALVACSADTQLAGAAFQALYRILYSGSSSSASTNTKTKMHAMVSTLGASLDPGFPLCVEQGVGKHQAIAIEGLDRCLPSPKMILDALKKNGYDPSRAVGVDVEAEEDEEDERVGVVGDKDAKKSTKHDKKQQHAGEFGGLRVHAIKLLLATASLLACSPTTRALFPSDPSSLSDLIVAVLHLGLDPISLRVQEAIDIAVSSLVSAFPSAEVWSYEAPRIARRLLTLGPSSLARLRLLRQIPTFDFDHGCRGRQLQRYTGCLLLENTLPKRNPLLPKISAIPTRKGAAMVPSNILLAQPWFRNPKGLVLGVRKGAAQSSAKAKQQGQGYGMVDIEVLLHICDLLLWKAAMKQQKKNLKMGVASPPPSAGPGSADVVMMDDEEEEGDGEGEEELSNDFLRVWYAFLAGLQRNIRALNPEDMVVKTMASGFEFRYKDALDRPAWGSPLKQ